MAEPIAWLVEYETVNGWEGEGENRHKTWTAVKLATAERHQARHAARCHRPQPSLRPRLWRAATRRRAVRGPSVRPACHPSDRRWLIQ
jgi:hypothetical protein